MNKLIRTIGTNPAQLFPAVILTCVAALFLFGAGADISPMILNSLLLAGCCSVLLLTRPITALYLLVVLSLFQTILSHWFESLYTGTWRDILTIAILALLAVKYTIKRKGFYARTPVTGLFLIFAALIFIQIFNPALPSIDMGIFGFRVYFVPMLGLFIGLNFISSKDELAKVWLLLLVSLTLAAILGIIQAKMGFSSYENLSQYVRSDIGHSYTGYSWYRVSSLFGSVWEFGNLMTFMILVSLPLYPVLKEKKHKILLFFATTVLFTGLIASAALSSIYGTLIGTSAYVILLKKRKTSFVIVALIMISVSALLLEKVGWERVIFYFFSNHKHQFLWAPIPFHEALLANLKGNFFGKGMGISLDSVAMRFGFTTNLFKEIYPDHSMEGDYFSLMAQAGFPAMILLGVIHVKVFFHGLRIRRMLSDPILKSAALGISILMIPAVMISIFRSFITLRPLDLFIWIAIGLLFSLPRLEMAGKLGEIRNG